MINRKFLAQQNLRLQHEQCPGLDVLGGELMMDFLTSTLLSSSKTKHGSPAVEVGQLSTIWHVKKLLVTICNNKLLD